MSLCGTRRHSGQIYIVYVHRQAGTARAPLASFGQAASRQHNLHAQWYDVPASYETSRFGLSTLHPRDMTYQIGTLRTPFENA